VTCGGSKLIDSQSRSSGSYWRGHFCRIRGADSPAVKKLLTRASSRTQLSAPTGPQLVSSATRAIGLSKISCRCLRRRPTSSLSGQSTRGWSSPPSSSYRSHSAKLSTCFAQGTHARKSRLGLVVRLEQCACASSAHARSWIEFCVRQMPH